MLITYKKAWLILIFSSLLLLGFDFFLNDYFRFLQPIDQIQENSILPHELSDNLPAEVKVIASKQTNVLFSRLDLNVLDVQVWRIDLAKNIEKFALIYRFNEQENLYFKIRKALSEVLETDENLFDANNLGQYSLYYNDSARSDTVFLLTLINDQVWGFEYPRKNHEEIKNLIKRLVESK